MMVGQWSSFLKQMQFFLRMVKYTIGGVLQKSIKRVQLVFQVFQNKVMQHAMQGGMN